MLEQAQQVLEFHGVADLLRRRIAGPQGAARLDALRAAPRLPTAEAAAASLAEVGEAMQWLRSAEQPEGADVSPPPQFSGTADIRGALERLAVEGAVLDALEIRDVLGVLERAEAVRRALRSQRRRPLLAAYGARLAEFKPLLRELSGKILPAGEISSLASAELSRIRRRIESQRRSVKTSLENFMRKSAASGALQDDYVTIRNGRSVVPVKASWKGRIAGVVHGGSAGGQTVFVEPLDTIAQNNRLVRLLEDEQREMLRILREITERLRRDGPAVGDAEAVLGELDYVFARARFGREFRCCLPSFCRGEPRLILERARHPLLHDLLARQGKQAEPLSVRLEGGRRALLLSGPNAGGKTVVLKTVGLLALMAQAGLPVPADEARLPWFEEVMADVGDAQSIASGLSTFSAHVSRLTAMLERASPRSLILLDELGSATDPEEGGALGAAIVQRLLERGAFLAVSTHLPALKAFGFRSPAVVSAAMDFDEDSLAPTYALLLGVPGRSAGLETARRFGMPPEVIEQARNTLGKTTQEASLFLADLRRRAAASAEAESRLRAREQALAAREAELERSAAAQAEQAKEQTERRIADLTRALERRHRQALQEAVEKLQAADKSGLSRQAAERLAAKSQGALRRRMEQAARAELGPAASLPDRPADEPKVGAQVRIRSMGACGTILRSLAPGRWEVQVGRLKVQAEAGDIDPLDPRTEPPAALPAGVRFDPAPRAALVPAEINVIGKTADEARAAVDKYLDDAFLAEMPRVRVIHGFGRNVLRRELSQMLSGHVHVAKHYDAEAGEGGGGATIVEMRL